MNKRRRYLAKRRRRAARRWREARGWLDVFRSAVIYDPVSFSAVDEAAFKQLDAALNRP